MLNKSDIYLRIWADFFWNFGLNGVIAGKAAGCRVAAITTSFAETLLLSAGADSIVHNFQELRKLLD